MDLTRCSPTTKVKCRGRGDKLAELLAAADSATSAARTVELSTIFREIFKLVVEAHLFDEIADYHFHTQEYWETFRGISFVPLQARQQMLEAVIMTSASRGCVGPRDPGAARRPQLCTGPRVPRTPRTRAAAPTADWRRGAGGRTNQLVGYCGAGAGGGAGCTVGLQAALMMVVLAAVVLVTST